ncbi:hypothetical protein XO10_02160 [Marinitoga sp. 1135]|uniref:hypothetical protein n=1 Tax=Marinitoga sp. 1135 TaxID=1643333 RepID=UPI00158682C7|nr:hypothetical protein [Marinitoga sp. 1135]NUU95100.1 hypothetical protein [Marinitoga sp. 1135]
MRKKLILIVILFSTIFATANNLILSPEGKIILKKELDKLDNVILKELDYLCNNIYNDITSYEVYTPQFVNDITDFGSNIKSIWYKSKDKILKIAKKNPENYNSYVKKIFEHYYFDNTKLEEIIENHMKKFLYNINKEFYIFMNNLYVNLEYKDKIVLENNEKFKLLVKTLDIYNIFDNDNIFSDNITVKISKMQNLIVSNTIVDFTYSAGAIITVLNLLGLSNPITFSILSITTYVWVGNVIKKSNDEMRKNLINEINKNIEIFSKNLINKLKKEISKKYSKKVKDVVLDFNLEEVK